MMRPEVVILYFIITVLLVEGIFHALEKLGISDIGVSVLSVVLLYSLILSNVINIIRFLRSG